MTSLLFKLAGYDADGDLDWQERGLCAQTDPEVFFPENGGTTKPAKRICLACDVRAECLQYALDHDERFGVWGGLSERDRRRLKKRGVKAVAAAVTEARHGTDATQAATVTRLPEQRPQTAQEDTHVQSA